jgi:diadenosine tetraphosphate (Ap4A) HIT family hydrolase
LAGKTAYSPYPPDVVRLMKLHKAKGLEADVVFLVDPCGGVGAVVVTCRPMTCVFCDGLARRTLVAENDLAVAFLDSFPLSPGHCLVIPRRHEPDFLALTPEEQAAIWALVAPVRRHIETGWTPDGYNIGINVGTAAGQTVAHAHLHVIPRRQGDVADARGGVRWIIPAKARYWEGP